jgi:hypothetical protein
MTHRASRSIAGLVQHLLMMMMLLPYRLTSCHPIARLVQRPLLTTLLHNLAFVASPCLLPLSCLRVVVEAPVEAVLLCPAPEMLQQSDH